MTFLKIFVPLVVVVLLGGFFWIALSDTPVEQKEIQKVIPNARFSGNAAP